MAVSLHIGVHVHLHRGTCFTRLCPVRRGLYVTYGVECELYIFTSEHYNTMSPEGHLMLGGALYYLITGSIMVLCGIISLRTPARAILWGISSLTFTFLASWLFWVGFVTYNGAE
jgi:hypothetical protein